MKSEWVNFETDTGLKAKYKIVGEDLRIDVKIKIVTKLNKTHFYSAVNEAGAYYDEQILPTLKQQS